MREPADRDLDHAWDVAPDEAALIQARLARLLETAWDGRAVARVGGVDVGDREGVVTAAIAVLAFPSLEPVEDVVARRAAVFPYVPGLFAFRAGPSILDAWAALSCRPDLLLFSAQGTAHPRRCGLAAHLGLRLGVPSIGAARSRLYGRADAPGPARGDHAPLRDEAERARTVGVVLRTQDGVRPLYVSPGHLVDLERCAEFVLACAPRYRIPEPLRRARALARRS